MIISLALMTAASCGRRLRFVVLISVAPLTLLPSGCGSSSVALVEGTVTLNDKALETGVVTFYPVASGPAATSSIGPGGRYRLTTGQSVGVAPGTYLVTIDARQPPSGPADEEETIGKLLVPERYTDKLRSGFRFEIQPGAQTIDLSMKLP